MVDNPAERERMGAVGRAFVERKFDRRTLASEMLEALEEACGKSRT
jgi:glycosyltransferase involved in cell wall biosynthesis